MLIYSLFLTLKCCHKLYRISPLLSYFIYPFLWEYFHVSGSQLVFTGTQKQIQFMYMLSRLLTLLFPSNMLHLQQRNSIISCLIYSSYYHGFCEDKDTDHIRDTKVILLSHVCHLHSLFNNARVKTLRLPHFSVSLSLSYHFLPSVSSSSGSSFM